MFQLGVSVCALLSLSAALHPKVPKSWKVCKRSDPQLNSCLKGAIQEAVYSMKSGYPPLGVFPIDPLYFETLRIDEGSGPINIKLDFKNLNITGISSLKPEKVRADWSKNFIEGFIKFSNPLALIGNYSINGKILFLPITGNGKCNLTFDDFAVRITISGKEYYKNKLKYYEVTKLTVELFTSRLHFYLGNLFNGDKALGENMNIFLNENWNEILLELRPSISKTFGEAFKQIANRVFSRIPIDQLSPA